MLVMTNSTISPVSPTTYSTEMYIFILFMCIKDIKMEIDALETTHVNVVKRQCKDHHLIGCTALQERHIPTHGKSILIVNSKFPVGFAICIRSNWTEARRVIPI